MASKRKVRRRSCTGKQRHATRTEAVAHVISLKKTQGQRVHSYFCPFCRSFHVGH